MSNPFNGSKRGKRGGIYRASKMKARVFDARPSALRKGHPLSQPASAPSTWSATESQAIHWEKAEAIEETTETHLIPRRSRADQLHLKLQEPRLEFENMRERRALKRWNGFKGVWEMLVDKQGNPIFVKGVPGAEGWIEVPRRLVWKSETTLLRRGIPDAMPKDYKVIDPTTKRIDYSQRTEEPATLEIPALSPQDLEDLNLD